MAKELFNMWDQTGKGVLPINELSEQLIGLGLSQSHYQSQQILKVLKETGHLGEPFLTEQEFLSCFEPDKLGV